MKTLDTETHGLDRPPAPSLVLVVAWVAEEPGRLGEVLVVPGAGRVVRIGRGPGEGDAERLVPSRLRPGSVRPAGPFASPRLSRDQLELVVEPESALLRCIGRGGLRVDGRSASEVDLLPGQVVEVEGRLTLLVDHRLVSQEGWEGRSEHPFGAADADGLVGESPEIWEVRRQLDFLGPRRRHVLVRGPSGSGKELAAAGLHRRSGRRGALVARNATTLPEGIVDAELFGNQRGYPNPGMAARPGLVGAAEGGTLFLDEIGDLPESIQPHLLRLLDGGEYHVLGDDRARRADLRVVGATHRPPEALRHDLAARFPLLLDVPGLDRRPSDVPLLARHLLRRILAQEGDLARRFLDPAGEPRVAQGLVRHLLTRRWRAHVRELEAVLWASLQTSRGDVLEEVPEADPSPPATAASASPPDWTSWVGAPPESLPKEVLEAALAAHNGHQERTAEALGLSSRFVLLRLVKRHGIAVVRRPGD